MKGIIWETQTGMREYYSGPSQGMECEGVDWKYRSRDLANRHIVQKTGVSRLAKELFTSQGFR
jgi:hypothetical protein